MLPFKIAREAQCTEQCSAQDVRQRIQQFCKNQNRENRKEIHRMTGTFRSSSIWGIWSTGFQNSSVWTWEPSLLDTKWTNETWRQQAGGYFHGNRLALEISGKELHYLLTDVWTTGCLSGKKTVLEPHTTLRSNSKIECEKQDFKNT